MSGKYSVSQNIRGFGRADVRSEWRARRTDYNWQNISKRFKEFSDWFNETREDLEQDFYQTVGRPKIQAARLLFDFAVEAEERKKRLESEAVYSGSWEGGLSESVTAERLGRDEFSMDLQVEINALNRGALDPLLMVSGNGENGRRTLDYTVGMMEATVKGEQSLTFSGLITGKFMTSTNNILLDVTAHSIGGTGETKSDFSRAGQLTSRTRYRNGAIKTKAVWPEMEALLFYLKILTKDTSAMPDLGGTESLPEEEIIPPIQLEGSLNWTPQELPDIKNEYFRLWFDTFQSVIKGDIASTPDLKARAEFADDLFHGHVKCALADGQRYHIKKEIMDHCKLWPAMPESSLDEAFSLYFESMDGWYLELIHEAPSTGAKRDRAHEMFSFSIRVCREFEYGLVSEALQRDLALIFPKEGSYPDKCFDQYLILHDDYWAERIGAASGFLGKNSQALEYFNEVPRILLYTIAGVLSDTLIDALGLEPGTSGGYADRCFRKGWDLGLGYFLPQLPAQGKANAAADAFANWLLKEELFRICFGYTSSPLNKEVEDRWTWLLDKYPSIRRRFKL
jgi:hypothetical protein